MKSATIKAIIFEMTGKPNVPEETTIESLGLDSLEFVALMVDIGKQIKEIPQEKWKSLNTVGDICRAVEG